MKVSRFVRETLEAYASEAVADGVLRRALAMAGLAELPASGEKLAELIDVYLVSAAGEALGMEPAEAIRQRLQPLVSVISQLAASSPEGGPERPTWVDAPVDHDGRVPTREIALKPFSVVLLAGRDPDVATQLKMHLDSRTAVIPVEAPAVLVRDLRLLRTQPRMLVIDARRPHALMDAVVGEPDLLSGAIVVLWGAQHAAEADFRRSFPTARLVCCGRDASVSDLAAIARLGPGGS